MTGSTAGGHRQPAFSRDICVIGGCGHIGLPLAMTLADCGFKTVIYDTNTAAAHSIRQGTMPFYEEGGHELLQRVLASGNLQIDDTPAHLGECRFVVLIVGTPLDEHLTPSFRAMHRVLGQCREHLRDGQTVVLRSTVFPGTSQHLQEDFQNRGVRIGVAFCPERTVQGQTLAEMRTIPQIVSAFDADTLKSVKELFGTFCIELIETTPAEAEMAKLACNAFRYIQFATANAIFTIATEQGLDFGRILHACKHHYPRMSAMPVPGFAAGPCLMKDAMQLAAFSNNAFLLGHAAMLMNEGLPAHVVRLLKREMNLSPLTVGILGMAFKPQSDDKRDSLSYRLRKVLSLECRRVLATDPYVVDPSLVPLEQVLAESDVLVLATRHRAYDTLDIPAGKTLIDPFDMGAAPPVRITPPD